MSEERRDLLTKELFNLLENLSGLAFSATDAKVTFAELGLDSLQLTQAAQTASKTFGVKLKLRQFVDEYPSPDALVGFLETQVPAHLFAAPQAATPQPAPAPATVIHDDPVARPVVRSGQAPRHRSADASALETLFSQQLDLMRQQLEMLGGPAPAAAPSSQAPQAASPTAPVPAQPVPEPKTADPAAPVKGHGPQLVIDRVTKKDLTPTQEKYLKNLRVRYAERTKKSKEFTQRNRASIADPRAVAGFKPQMKEFVYPIVVDKSKGCHLWDLDGNEYVDMLSGYGSNFFGFGAPFVKEALARQLEIGMEIGPQSSLIEEVSALFREFVPMDRIAFCNTGSEAVLAALRMARTATGKDLVVMFSGGYHGIFDEVVARTGGKGKSVPAAPGIPAQAVENLLILDWANDDSLEVIRQRADEIAAVITEPVQSRRPEVQPAEFHKKLRKVTEENGIALIFDEVVTGFRVGPGGAQEYFGIQADLTTYGKVIGGGISIGIVAGKREYMDALDGGAWQFGDSSVPEVGVTYFAGTFVRHPLSLAVTIAVFKFLKEKGPSLYKDLNEKTDRLAKALNALFKKEGAPVKLHHFCSVIKVDADHDVPFYELLFIVLRLKGVHVWDGRPNFMTLAHTQQDLDFIINAFKEAIEELQEGGFYPVPAKQSRADQPPVPGARLGKNKAGNPAWFIPDPTDAKQFIEVK